MQSVESIVVGVGIPKVDKLLLKKYHSKYDSILLHLSSKYIKRIRRLFLDFLPTHLTNPYTVNFDEFEKRLRTLLYSLYRTSFLVAKEISRIEFRTRPTSPIDFPTDEITQIIVAHTKEKLFYWWNKGRLSEVYSFLRNHYFAEVRSKRIAITEVYRGVNLTLFSINLAYYEFKAWASGYNPSPDSTSSKLHGTVIPMLALFPSPNPEKYFDVLFPPLHPLDRSLLFFPS